MYVLKPCPQYLFSVEAAESLLRAFAGRRRPRRATGWLARSVLPVKWTQRLPRTSTSMHSDWYDDRQLTGTRKGKPLLRRAPTSRGP